MNTKRILLALILVVFATPPSARPRAQPDEPAAKREREAALPAANGNCDWLCQLKERQAQQLEGSWVLTVNAVVPPGAPQSLARTSYTSFARGGVALLYERQAAFVNPAYGAWEYQGGNEFAFTVMADAFDPAGNLLATMKLRNKLTLIGADEFDSVGFIEVRNPAGNLSIQWVRHGARPTHQGRVAAGTMPERQTAAMRLSPDEISVRSTGLRRKRSSLVYCCSRKASGASRYYERLHPATCNELKGT